MDIYFVRHGHPNYKEDCLTELGHKHAAAAAESLKNFGIQQIFSSTCGRAYETAEYTARKLNLEIQKCDFMREISSRPLNENARFQKKTVWDWLPEMIANGEAIADPNWKEKDAYCNTKLVSSYQTVTEGIDRWLASLGYTREGDYYRVGENTDKTVAMFSHGGSSSAVFSYLLGIPFPLFCATVHLNFTSITLLRFSNEKGRLVVPRVVYMGDAKHIEELDKQDSAYGV